MEAKTSESLEKLITLLKPPPIPNSQPPQSSANEKMPTVLLYIDEVHSAQTRLPGDPKHRTNYSALTRAIDSFKSKALLAIFTSTMSRLYELAPPQMVHSSARVVGNDAIPLPFWELPFDVNVGKMSRSRLTLEEITSTAHIVKFGRPL